MVKSRTLLGRRSILVYKRGITCVLTSFFLLPYPVGVIIVTLAGSPFSISLFAFGCSPLRIFIGDADNDVIQLIARSMPVPRCICAHFHKPQDSQNDFVLTKLTSLGCWATSDRSPSESARDRGKELHGVKSDWDRMTAGSGRQFSIQVKVLAARPT